MYTRWQNLEKKASYEAGQVSKYGANLGSSYTSMNSCGRSVVLGGFCDMVGPCFFGPKVAVGGERQVSRL